MSSLVFSVCVCVVGTIAAIFLAKKDTALHDSLTTFLHLDDIDGKRLAREILFALETYGIAALKVLPVSNPSSIRFRPRKTVPTLELSPPAGEQDAGAISSNDIAAAGSTHKTAGSCLLRRARVRSVQIRRGVPGIVRVPTGGYNCAVM